MFQMLSVLCNFHIGCRNSCLTSFMAVDRADMASAVVFKGLPSWISRRRHLQVMCLPISHNFKVSVVEYVVHMHDRFAGTLCRCRPCLGSPVRLVDLDGWSVCARAVVMMPRHPMTCVIRACIFFFYHRTNFNTPHDFVFRGRIVQSRNLVAQNPSFFE